MQKIGCVRFMNRTKQVVDARASYVEEQHCPGYARWVRGLTPCNVEMLWMGTSLPEGVTIPTERVTCPKDWPGDVIAAIARGEVAEHCISLQKGYLKIEVRRFEPLRHVTLQECNDSIREEIES